MNSLDRIKSRAKARRDGSYLGRHLGKTSCFLQHDQNIANDTGAAVRSDLNNALGALFTLSSGATTPSTTIAYMLWADTTSGLLKQRNAANTGWLVRGTLAETFVVARSSNTILAAGDFGKLFKCTSTFTQTLTAAATLGDGWFVSIRNDGTGVITIDPDGAETIDGATTLVLNPGESCAIRCDGSNFKTVGLPAVRSSYDAKQNLEFAVSANAGALTIALKTFNGNDPTAANPVKVPFRSATAANGDYDEISVTAASSLVLTSGSTLGATSGAALRAWIVGFNDAGTFRLGAVNCLSGTSIMALKDDDLRSSTAEGGAGAADSAQVIYTGTAVASKAMRILGYAEWSTLTTAGTWTAPTKVQLFGAGVPLPGQTIQVQRTATGALATGSTAIPVDDTIPQITEGDQVMSQAITPTSAANILDVDSQVHIASDTSSSLAAALFQDATAGALAVSSHRESSVGNTVNVSVRHRMLAGGTAATTLMVRVGASAGTTTFNGSGGARAYGGVLNSFLQASEIMG